MTLPGTHSAASPIQSLIRVVIQIFMEKFNGLGVILENRYYGQSYPFNTSTTDDLRFLTTEQSKGVEHRNSLLRLTGNSDRR
jgi:hypothetical protein